VGGDMNWQGQPTLQLQVDTTCPCSRQSIMAIRYLLGV
jgi:hypothetical protein